MEIDITDYKKGAVLSCYFPLAEKPDKAGPVARPALLVRAFFDHDDGIAKAIVAYGTSRQTRANAGFEIRVGQPQGMAAAGLNMPTRFTLSRMRILPLNREFFSFGEHGSPVLGHLEQPLMKRMEDTCGILVGLANEFRPILGGPGSHQAGSKNLSDAEIDAISFDKFMQERCTGRSNLNGIRRRA